MSKSGFEFSGFFAPPVEREFLLAEGMEPGTGVQIFINLDLLTIEKMQELEAEFNAIFDDSVAPIRKALDAVADAEQKDRDSEEAGADTDKPEVTQLPKLELFALEKAKFKFFARALAGPEGDTNPSNRLLHSWNVVRDKKAVPISYESFLQMPPHGLIRLYRFCIGEANNPTAQEKKQ